MSLFAGLGFVIVVVVTVVELVTCKHGLVLMPRQPKPPLEGVGLLHCRVCVPDWEHCPHDDHPPSVTMVIIKPLLKHDLCLINKIHCLHCVCLLLNLFQLIQCIQFLNTMKDSFS